MRLVHVDSTLAIALFAAILATRELGRWLGRRPATEVPGDQDGTAAIEAAVFGLYGLLVAFTFGSAMARFDAREELIIEEASVLGSAWAALDLVPSTDQPALRETLRRYLDARLEGHRRIPDWEAAGREMQRAQSLSRELWRGAVASLERAGYPATTGNVLDALARVPEAATHRKAALGRHQLPVIFGLLVVFALGSALTSGYASARRPRRNWFHALLFASVSAIALFVILDLEHPREGLFRLDRADQVLLDLRSSMEAAGD